LYYNFIKKFPAFIKTYNTILKLQRYVRRYIIISVELVSSSSTYGIMRFSRFRRRLNKT